MRSGSARLLIPAAILVLLFGGAFLGGTAQAIGSLGATLLAVIHLALHLRRVKTVKQSAGAIDPPRPLEGISIGLAAVTLAGWQVATYAGTAVPWIYPEYRATRVGPEGFPMTIHIGREALRLTNGSDYGWYCDISLGQPKVLFTLPTAARIEAHSSIDVPLGEFHSLDLGPGASIRERAARDGMKVQCSAGSNARTMQSSYYSAIF